MKSDLVEVTVKIVHETEKALLVSNELTKKPIWIPKSAVGDSEPRPKGWTLIVIKQSLAEEKGLV